MPSSPVAAPANTKQPSTWNLSSVLNFQPSDICCGTSPKGDHCTSKLYPYTSNSIPGKPPQAMQEEILEQLVATNFRSSAKTKQLLHKLTGLSLCGQHRRQQDRLERRWTKDIEAEKVRKKKEEERRQRRVEMGLGGVDDEIPESPTPIARGGRRPSPSGVQQTRHNFDQLASRGPRIQPPIFGKKSATNPATAAHWDVPPTTPALLERGAHPPTLRATPDILERRPLFGSNRRDPPAPSINALIDTPRQYKSRRTSTNSKNPDNGSSATRIPKPTIPIVRRPFYSMGAYPNLDALPPSPALTLPSARREGIGHGEWKGERGDIGRGDLEEIRVLQDSILRNQEIIIRDQGRIIVILLGGCV
ncbi:hypothetical protein E6O75_ATG07964 [Venturia nashicola]|uniref:Uncharacterized protein n=1 Tax=Venturia nashicola TaxID=86259 RepID=A0A4Z1NNC8_9PEZI|nr:hypothetical protein E6O75_ATG07964 [Venturia nashicola]